LRFADGEDDHGEALESVECEETKIKKLRIGIRSVDEAMEDFAKAAKSMERGEPVAKMEGLYFTDLRAFRRAITDQRLAILRTIKERNPDSVYELAKILQRDVKNISADLSNLQELGLVELRKTKTLQGKVKPSVPYDSIQLDIAV
jgi:predicted transcriptional regulator